MPFLVGQSRQPLGHRHLAPLGGGQLPVAALQVGPDPSQFRLAREPGGVAGQAAEIQRSVRFQQFPLQGHEPAPPLRRQGERRGFFQRPHQPGVGQQQRGEIGAGGDGAEQFIGPADHPGVPREIGHVVRGEAFNAGGTGLSPLGQGEKPDAGGEPRGPRADGIDQQARVGDHDQLGAGPQRDIDQRGVFEVALDQFADLPEDVLKGPARLPTGQGQQVADPQAQPLLPTVQLLEQDLPGLERGPFLAELGDGLPLFGEVGLQRGPLGVQGSQPLAMGGGELGGPVMPLLLGVPPLFGLLLLGAGPLDRGLAFEPAGVPFLPAGFEHGGPTAQCRLFLSDVEQRLPLGFPPLPERLEFRRQRFRLGVGVGDGVAAFGEGVFEAVQAGLGLFEFASDLLHPVGEIALLLVEPLVLAIEFVQPLGLMPQGRLVAGDPFAEFSGPMFAVAEVVFRGDEGRLEFALLGFAALGLLGELGDQLLQFALVVVELGEAQGVVAVVVGGRPGPQLLQLGMMFAKLRRLRRLGAGRHQPGLDLLHNVGQAKQVLRDPFELALGFDLADLVAADARRLFKHDPAGGVARLQQLVHAPLLDDAVGGGPGTGPQEQVADVLEPGGRAVDEVLGFATAVDPPPNHHLVAVELQDPPRVVEGELGLGEASGLAAGRAVEDDVGHLFATEALGALVAQDPLDGIDDVALARAIRADDPRDARGEVEPRAVGEALEAEEFQRLEHRAAGENGAVGNKGEERAGRRTHPAGARGPGGLFFLQQVHETPLGRGSGGFRLLFGLGRRVVESQAPLDGRRLVVLGLLGTGRLARGEQAGEDVGGLVFGTHPNLAAARLGLSRGAIRAVVDAARLGQGVEFQPALEVRLPIGGHQHLRDVGIAAIESANRPHHLDQPGGGLHLLNFPLRFVPADGDGLAPRRGGHEDSPGLQAERGLESLV